MKKTRSSTGRPSPSKARKTSDALEIIDRHIVGDDPELRDQIDQARQALEVAQIIYDARTSAGLTQAELAAKIGSSQSVISRLEDADYEGHSLTMLRRIARALGKRLDIRFADAKLRHSA